MNIKKIGDISIGSTVESAYAVDMAKKSVAKNNKAYLDIILSDGVDTIACKKWDFEGPIPVVGSVVIIVGVVGEYPAGSGCKQMVLSRMRNVTPSDDVNISDFVKHSALSRQELTDTIEQLIGCITDADYHLLATTVFKMYRNEIQIAPAAIYHHQAYVGGLMEHMVQVTKAALIMADDTTNLSLLICGALLHDIGKIYTYGMDGLVIIMTDAGKLQEHLVVGTLLVHDVGMQICMNPQKRLLVEHIVLSHSGKMEWGSPITPKFKEAILVHQADMACVTASKIDKLIQDTPAGEKWSPYDFKEKTQVLIPRDGSYTVEPYILKSLEGMDD